MAPLSSSQPGTFASFFHDVGSNARTTSISHSHPLGTKITRQPRGLDALLWAPHFAASTPSLGRYISRRLYLLGPTFLCDSARYIFLRLSCIFCLPLFLFYRDVPKITRNSASVLKNVRVLTPPRLLTLVFQNLELLELSFTPLTFDLADLESSRNGWIMNVVADSPSKGLDIASAKGRERKSRPFCHRCQ